MQGIVSAMRNVTPLLLSVCFILLICITAFIRRMDGGLWIDSFVNFDIVFTAAYLLWILTESKVAKREVTQGKNTSDFGTCELYAVGQALTFLSALWFGSGQSRRWADIIRTL
jgi:hypothetical protein